MCTFIGITTIISQIAQGVDPIWYLVAVGIFAIEIYSMLITWSLLVQKEREFRLKTRARKEIVKKIRIQINISEEESEVGPCRTEERVINGSLDNTE